MTTTRLTVAVLDMKDGDVIHDLHGARGFLRRRVDSVNPLGWPGRGKVTIAGTYLACGDVPAGRDVWIWADDRVAVIERTEAAAFTFYRGNDCHGPEGHREGCPVHCYCYDDNPKETTP